jgi:hypothetical protein
MLDHTPVYTLAAEIHILVKIEVDIDLADNRVVYSLQSVLTGKNRTFELDVKDRNFRFSTGYKPYQQIEDFDATLLSC